LAAAPGQEPSVFELHTNGLKSNRDAWNYNSSRASLDTNVTRMIEHFNAQVDAFAALHPGLGGTLRERADVAKQEVDLDPRRFSWDRANFADVARGTRFGAADRLIMTSAYRPFHRRWVEAGRRLNNTVYQQPKVFPSADTDNMTIVVSTVGARNPFTAFASRELPDVHLWVDDTPCFPRYVYEVDQSGEHTPAGLFDSPSSGDGSGRRHNVTDHALDLYRLLDPGIDRDDIFFYVYGILHSTDYRIAYAADLKKSLPRIPQVESAEMFWAFSNAGRDLAHLHTEYESIDPWPELTYSHADQFDAEHPDAYRVLKMKHPKVPDPVDPKGRKVDDRSRIIYNDWITIENIPERAYGYELGSRSAIAWVMESNRVRTDKASGIVNDPNDWAAEHDDPTYILDLLGRVVAVSMRTLDIVEGLPSLDL
jgi:predicted helicase